MSVIAAPLGVGLVAALLLLAGDLRRERRRVRDYLVSLGPWDEDPMAWALTLAASLGRRHTAGDDPVYLSPLFRALGGTASDLIARGGCCSGLSRLHMVALEARGIRANQIPVQPREGYAQHCLVEVHLPRGPACIDPLYGLHYTDAAGRPLGLEDLQSGVPVHCRPIPGARRSGYPANDYYAFDYRLTRTANWTRSWPRRAAYAALRAFWGERVNRMRVPQLLEWPQALLALLLVGLTCAGSGAVLLSRLVIS